MVMVSLFVFGSAPLSILGSICGRNVSGDFDAPCRVHKVPRQVPEVPFYRGALVHVLIGGFLPFSAIYIEMHYIFEAMWGHKIYTLFGILFIAICLVVLVTAFITVALTYFQLAVEVCVCLSCSYLCRGRIFPPSAWRMGDKTMSRLFLVVLSLYVCHADPYSYFSPAYSKLK